MLDKDNIPKHIALIMDGNGRWAKQRGQSRTAGHRAGIDRVKEIIEAAREFGVKVVTFFAFSTENWSRPKAEVNALMRYLNNFLEREIKKLDNKNTRFIAIGAQDPLPHNLQNRIREAQNKTKDNTGLAVVLALNYGARQEIVEATKKITHSVMQGELNLDNLNPQEFNNYLYTAGLPDPDLLIRTSGEMRISNFLLWQISYAELYFCKKYWPDFKKEDLKEAIETYQERERRFGKIDADKKDN